MTITQHQTLLGFYKKALIDSVAIEEDLLKESNKAILELDEFKVKGIDYKDSVVRDFLLPHYITIRIF